MNNIFKELEQLGQIKKAVHNYGFIITTDEPVKVAEILDKYNVFRSRIRSNLIYFSGVSIR